MNALIKADDLAKSYGNHRALDAISFEVNKGQIVGLIGPNGAGKTTLLKTLLGLTAYEGKLNVLGLNPAYKRHQLMQKMCFIADVAILPKWLVCDDAIEFVKGVHPKFDEAKAKALLKKTQIKPKQKVRELSKGMIVQLHLALVMAIDVELLILDEPTLGLDIIYRKRFYQSLLNDYFNDNRTIVVTTHQIEEVEGLLSHIMMLNHGKILLNCPVSQLESEFYAVKSSEHEKELMALNPLYTQKKFNQTEYLFEAIAKDMLTPYGEVYCPSISDIFQAKVLNEEGNHGDIK
ncbi:ABC transporter ATP-binding protein [Thiotrichales bacterium 19S3-7]|nr:ABC transporter ATP-binding protein [Thiotrichales bacterium 19S3-7]MCF6800877.1 ABC transporter ATP-binding protein [Thiotrichales bacterium 19S3-11]